MGPTRNARASQNAKKIFAYINQLFQDNYNKKLTRDEEFIFNCTIAGMNCEQIAIAHGKLKPERVQSTTSKLMGQLSDCLNEPITIDNFNVEIEKHYRALNENKN